MLVCLFHFIMSIDIHTLLNTTFHNFSKCHCTIIIFKMGTLILLQFII